MTLEVYTSAGTSRWRLVAGNSQEVANSSENFARVPQLLERSADLGADAL